MNVSNKIEGSLLFVGDIVVFTTSLWLALFLRYAEYPDMALYVAHIIPFSFLFPVWVLVFFISGLYEKHTLALKSRLSNLILRAQVVNSIIAVTFFYIAPVFSITPKTSLFLTLVISFLLLVLWRLVGVPFLGFRKRQNAILIGSGTEMRELREEVNNNESYSMYFVTSLDLDDVDGVDFQGEIVDRVYSEDISTIVVDLKSNRATSILPHLYNLIFSNVRFIDKYKVYEDIFDRVPLSLVGYNWFLENISSSSHMSYDTLKRTMDIGASLILGVVSLVVYPFIFLAIKLDDGGDIFFAQKRTGKNNNTIHILKFRTMSSEQDDDVTNSRRTVTKVGEFLRKSRLDELPQLWNVLWGDISLIGPRPEIPELVSRYEKEIPYYNMRYLVKPGLSGWAQMYHENHPHHGIDVRETKMKLSYDLYYIKNRSFILDVRIALKTVKILLSRSGV